MPTVQLYDHNDRPIDMSKLRQTVAAPTLSGVRSVITGHPAAGLTPERLASILRAAEQGDPLRYLELAEQMEEKDLHYLGVLNQRKRAVSQLELSVEAAGDDADAQADADLLEDWVRREAVEDELFDQLDAVGKGFSLLETGWDMSERQWWPSKLDWVDPRFIRFDPVDGRTPLLIGDTGQPQPLDPFKFVYTEIKAKSGLAIRGGLARPVSWAWMFKNYTVKDWVGFLEIYGMPLRVGKYGPDATADDRATLLRAIGNIAHDAAAMIPQSMAIDFVDGKQGNSDGALFSGAADWFDRQVSKAVLGQTMTTDAQAAGMGSNQASVQDGVRADIERSDAKALMAALNRDLVRPLIDLNRGKPAGRGYPRLLLGRAEQWDAAAQMPNVKAFVELGGKVGMSTIRDRLGIPDPGKDEELLKPGATPQPLEGPQGPLERPGGPMGAATAATRFLGLLTGLHGHIATASAAGNPIPDAIEAYIDDNLDDWQALVEPALSPVETLIAGCASYADVQARLAEAADDMGGDKLAEMLAPALFAARLAGAAGLTIADAAA